MGAQFSAQATQALGPCPGGHTVAGSLVCPCYLQSQRFVTRHLFQDCFDGDNEKSNLPLPSPRDNYPTIAPRISGAVRRLGTLTSLFRPSVCRQIIIDMIPFSATRFYLIFFLAFLILSLILEN